MLLGRADSPPASSDWSFELKYDGWRALVDISLRETRIWSRNGHDLTRRFPELHGLHHVIAPCVLDAELVVLDGEGRPRFEWIHRTRRPPAVLVAFDVLRIGRQSIIALPLEDRRTFLKDLLPSDLPAVLRTRPFADGVALLAQCEALNLEGIVAKRAGSRYRPGMRSDDWLKIRTNYGRELIRQRMENARA